MRELKFRAWDKEKKEWILNTNENPFYIIGETTVFNMLQHYSIKDFNNIIIMQFTGFCDKHGVELYEGDIIKITKGGYTGRPRVFRAIVVWDDFMAGFRLVEPSAVFDNRCDLEINQRRAKYCKVIGNIHQNPELLEQTEPK